MTHSGAMGVLEVRVGPPLLRTVPESRPPAQRWGASGTAVGETASGRDQPSLLDALQELLDDATAPPRPRGVRVHADTGPGSLRPALGLPDPAGWAAVLGLAVGQALVGARPVRQLETWLAASVLADLRCALHRLARTRAGGPAAAPPVRVVSVRVQCPTAISVEAAMVVRVGLGSMVLAVRLEAYGQRWLCTALARPEAPGLVTGLRPARDTA